MCTGGMMMETNNRVWGMALIAMLLLLFAGAYYEEETVAVSAPVLLAQQGEVSVYAGAINLPAGESVQFSQSGFWALQTCLPCNTTEWQKSRLSFGGMTERKMSSIFFGFSSLQKPILFESLMQ